MKLSWLLQRAVLHQHRGDSTASAIQLGFDHRAHRRAVRRRLQRLQIGDQADHFEQQIEVHPLLRRDIDEHRAAAPLFGNQSAIAQLFFHAIRLRFRLIDLVHRDDDRHVRRLGVVDGFERLRHHAVVGRNHDHHDVGDLGAARAHAREGFVTWRIEEDNLATEGRRIRLGDLHLVGADVLGDAARFAARDVGLADGIEQRRLAVIDVAHDRDHRRTRNFLLVGILAARGCSPMASLAI